MRGYGEDLAAIHAAGFTGLAVAAAHELLARLERSARVVDLGCGDGTTARLLSEAGHEVLGIDASPAMIALARERDVSPRLVCRCRVTGALRCDSRDRRGARYRFDARSDARTLDRVLVRAGRALRPGGLMLFDLAGPKRIPGRGRRSWQEGDGWPSSWRRSLKAETCNDALSPFAKPAPMASVAQKSFIACDFTHPLKSSLG
jgi:SAM-dependent methyltransferase